MNKKFWLAFIGSFIALDVLELVWHSMVLSGFYPNHPQGFRGEVNYDPMMYLWMQIGIFLTAFIWVYLYHRFVTEKNVKNGIEVGVILSIFYYVPWGFINYSLYVVSGYVYLWSTVGGVIMGAIIGALMGLILQEKKAE